MKYLVGADNNTWRLPDAIKAAADGDTIAGSFMIAELFHSLSTTCSHKATFVVLSNIRKSCCDKLAKVPLGYV